jgi:hypothetical protein
LLVTLFIAFQTVIAQDVKVFATTDTTEYTVGDYINYSIEMKYPKGVNLVIPTITDSISNLTFIKNGEMVKNEVGNEISEIRHFIFSKYDSSEVTIPAFHISYSANGGNPQFVQVNSVDIVVKTIEVNQQAEIQDIKAPIRIPIDWLLVLLIAILVLALIVAAYFGYKYYQKKKLGKVVLEPEIILTPFEKAIANLTKLEEKKLWQQGEIKEYHSELTGIIRDYFENKFNFIALEMTTSEIISNLKLKEVNFEVIKTTEEFLENADMVKFAKFKPMPTINETMMKQAYLIVNKTNQTSNEVVNVG